MKTRMMAATALGCAALFGTIAVAQTPAAPPAAAPKAAAPATPAVDWDVIHEAGYTVPHTKWGAPDLQGFWNNTSITSLRRGAEAKSLVVDEKEAKRLVNRNVLIVLSKEDQATNGQDPNNTKLLED